MTETVAATGTPAPVATPAAEPTSALATAAKSDGVESMLSAAAKAAAAEPAKHDADTAAKAALEAMAKVEFEGVPEPVTKAGREAFAKHNVTPEAAKEIVAALAEAQKQHREAADKAALAETDAAWQKELRDDKEFGGANYERNTKLVEEAVSGLLTKEQAQRAKDSGWLNHPLTGLFAMAAERIVARATKQDSTVAGAPPGRAREDINDLSPAALARSFGTI